MPFDPLLEQFFCQSEKRKRSSLDQSSFLKLQPCGRRSDAALSRSVASIYQREDVQAARIRKRIEHSMAAFSKTEGEFEELVPLFFHFSSLCPGAGGFAER